MNDAWLGVVSTLVGGLIGVSGSYVLEARRDRGHRRDRWDEHRLAAIVNVCVAAQNLEGAQYKRGRAAHDGAPDKEELEKRAAQAIEMAALLRSAMVAADFLCPEVQANVTELRVAVKVMRDVADHGFESRAPEWVAARDSNQLAIRSLQDAARRALDVG
jgi:hypothetical protein